MPSVGLKVIGPVTDFKIGAYGATEEQCVSVGGITKFTVKYKETVEDITDAEAGMAVIGGYGYKATADVDVEGDDISLANLAIAVRGTVAGDEMLATGSGGMLVRHAAYVYGLAADGEAKKMYIPALVFAPDMEIAPTYKQQTWQAKGNCYRDLVLGGLFQYLPDPAVATIPTLASSLPVNEAIDVAIADSMTLTFAVAVDAGQLDSAHIFLLDAANTFVPCVLSQVGAVVTVNPTASLDNSTEYRLVVVSGLKSLHGVVNPVGYVVSFTTVAP
jgi:hypothetical protein